MLKCPHCNKGIPGPSCPQCGTESPEGANYCLECGASLDKSEEVFIDDEGNIDFENRVLCPDGTCTGIMVDGKCSECGNSIEGS